MGKENIQISKIRSFNWKKITLYTILIGFLCCLTLLAIMLHWISSDIRAHCEKAKLEYKGDCVEALINYLEKENLSYKEKNNIIWALGEIGDKRAISALKKLITGETCNKPCNPKVKLCQYGVQKSIKLCEGSNLTRYVWKWI